MCVRHSFIIPINDNKHLWIVWKTKDHLMTEWSSLPLGEDMEFEICVPLYVFEISIRTRFSQWSEVEYDH